MKNPFLRDYLVMSVAVGTTTAIAFLLIVAFDFTGLGIAVASLGALAGGVWFGLRLLRRERGP